MMCSSVPAASRVLSGSGIAPARIDPKKNSMNSVRFPTSMATRSPGAHAESRQHARDAVHPLVELPVGGATLAAAEQVDDRHLVGHPRDGLVEEKAEIAPTIRIVHVTHAQYGCRPPCGWACKRPRVGEN